MADPDPGSGGQGMRPVPGRMLPAAALGFVLLSLVALAILPIVVAEWFQRAQREAEVLVLPARAHAVRLAMATERQVAAARGYALTGDAAHRARFRQAHAVQTASLVALAEVAPRLGPTAQEHLEAARALAARWHARLEHAVEAGTAIDGYDIVLAELEVLHDSLLLHVVALEDEIDRASATRLAGAAMALRIQRSLGIGLGALAILAALVVGWFARRQWQLTGRVERALDEANLLRARAEQAREELTRLTESRARLMRGFSHDVKNPLGAANGYLQLLADGILGPLSDQQQRAVDRASRSIGGAINLVDDLVELARAETGQLEVARDPTDLRRVVAEAADEYRAQAETKGLALDIESPAEFPLVPTDGRRVRQILGNLISNAVKYTDRGTVTVRLRLAPPDADTGRLRYVRLEVQDSGPGVPRDQQRLLFQEFVRLTPGTAGGAGLGLAISNRLARALGGKLTVDSEPGHGSTFALLLPLRRATDIPPT